MRAILKAVARWNVITDSPTTSGWSSRTSRSTVAITLDWTRMRSATATWWWGSTLPASEASAPFGMRTTIAGMCSKESGIDKRSTFMECNPALTILRGACISGERILMNTNTSFLLGFACGAGLMYVFDPGGGRRRRALLRDQVTHAVRKTGDGLDAAARDAANRVSGKVVKARRRLRREKVPDAVLIERVRAELGHIVSNPRAIDVEARNGH